MCGVPVAAGESHAGVRATSLAIQAEARVGAIARGSLARAGAASAVAAAEAASATITSASTPART